MLMLYLLLQERLRASLLGNFAQMQKALLVSDLFTFLELGLNGLFYSGAMSEYV